MDAIINYEKCEDDDFYKLLGCDETSSPDQILAEYRAKSLLCHPDKNQGAKDAATKFQKIQKAKEVLMDPEKRCLYDKWRRCGFTIPFSQFLNLNKAAHTSVHWVSKKNKDMMLEGQCCTAKNDCHSSTDHKCATTACRSMAWEREPANQLLQKFRNYEI